MNAFYKIKTGYWDDNKKYIGVATGHDEGEIMNKVLHFYGRDRVEQITFWFGENCEEELIEFEDFKKCPLFDLK